MSGERLASIGRWLCLAGATLGASGLIGWITGATRLTTVLVSQAPMMPNTAVALMLLGVAGALRHRLDAARVRTVISLVAALLVLGIGVGTLAEYLLDTDLGIDGLLLRTAGRPSPPTALALALLATALLVLDFRPTARARPSELLILAAGLIALAALAGMVLGAHQLYRLGSRSVIGVAPHTAIGLLLISFGLLLERAKAGFVQIATSNGLGGAVLRRLLLPTVFGPLLLAVLVTRVLALWVADFPLISAVLVVALTAVGCALLTITAAYLNQADRALRESEEKFSGVISIALDAIVSVDEDQRITIYNNGAQQIFGWTSNEVLGKHLDVLIPEHLREIHRQHVRDFAAEPAKSRKMGKRRRIFGLRKNGEEFPAEATISKLAIDGSRHFTVVLRDVTERARTEWETQFRLEVSAVLAVGLDSSEMLASVARLAVREFTDCCIVDLVEKTGIPKRYLVVHADRENAGVCQVLEEIEPGNIGHQVIESGQPVLLPELSEELVGSEQRPSERLQAFRKLDAKSGMIVPMVTRGRVLGTLTLITTGPLRRHDARDLHIAQELARQTILALENARLYEDARQAIRARDEVLGVVAHDLRNPLSAIIMTSELLQQPAPSKPAETILRAAKRMNRLIQDLLDEARLDAGRLTVAPERVPPDRVVLDAVESQKRIATAACLELQVDVTRGIPEVLADRDRLLQILENLIGNAIKFTKAGGITVGAAPRASEVLFWVADTGQGIAADDLPHVFERFWQVRKGERRGVGLGLAIVKSIVDAHGGRIWVESTPGRGSSFFFTIPAAARAEF